MCTKAILVRYTTSPPPLAPCTSLLFSLCLLRPSILIVFAVTTIITHVMAGRSRTVKSANDARRTARVAVSRRPSIRKTCGGGSSRKVALTSFAVTWNSANVVSPTVPFSLPANPLLPLPLPSPFLSLRLLASLSQASFTCWTPLLSFQSP